MHSDLTSDAWDLLWAIPSEAITDPPLLAAKPVVARRVAPRLVGDNQHHAGAAATELQKPRIVGSNAAEHCGSKPSRDCPSSPVCPRPFSDNDSDAQQPAGAAVRPADSNSVLWQSACALPSSVDAGCSLCASATLATPSSSLGFSKRSVDGCNEDLIASSAAPRDDNGVCAGHGIGSSRCSSTVVDRGACANSCVLEHLSLADTQIGLSSGRSEQLGEPVPPAAAAAQAAPQESACGVSEEASHPQAPFPGNTGSDPVPSSLGRMIGASSRELPAAPASVNNPDDKPVTRPQAAKVSSPAELLAVPPAAEDGDRTEVLPAVSAPLDWTDTVVPGEATAATVAVQVAPPPWSVEALRQRLRSRDPRLQKQDTMGSVQVIKSHSLAGLLAEPALPAGATALYCTAAEPHDDVSLAAGACEDPQVDGSNHAAAAVGLCSVLPPQGQARVAAAAAVGSEQQQSAAVAQALPPLRRGPSTTSSRLLARLRPGRSQPAAAVRPGKLPTGVKKRSGAGVAAAVAADLLPRPPCKTGTPGEVKGCQERPAGRGPVTVASGVPKPGGSGVDADMYVMDSDPTDSNPPGLDNNGFGVRATAGMIGQGDPRSILDDVQAALAAAAAVSSGAAAGSGGAAALLRRRPAGGGVGQLITPAAAAADMTDVWPPRRAWVLPPPCGRFDFRVRKRRAGASTSGAARPPAGAGLAAAVFGSDSRANGGHYLYSDQDAHRHLPGAYGTDEGPQRTRKRNATAATAPAPDATTAVGSSVAEVSYPTLQDGLDEWRRCRARSVRKNPETLLRWDLLVELAERCPTSVLELEGVPGLLRPWVRQYGQEVLDVCRNWVHVRAAAQAAAGRARRAAAVAAAAAAAARVLQQQTEGSREEEEEGVHEEQPQEPQGGVRGSGADGARPGIAVGPLGEGSMAAAAAEEGSRPRDGAEGASFDDTAAPPEGPGSCLPAAKRRRVLVAPTSGSPSQRDSGAFLCPGPPAGTPAASAEKAQQGEPDQGQGVYGRAAAPVDAAPGPPPPTAGAAPVGGVVNLAPGMPPARAAGVGDSRDRMRRQLLDILGLQDGPSLGGQLLREPTSGSRTGAEGALGASGGAARRRRRLVQGPGGPGLASVAVAAAAEAGPDDPELADFSGTETEEPSQPPPSQRPSRQQSLPTGNTFPDAGHCAAAPLPAHDPACGTSGPPPAAAPEGTPTGTNGSTSSTAAQPQSCQPPLQPVGQHDATAQTGVPGGATGVAAADLPRPAAVTKAQVAARHGATHREQPQQGLQQQDCAAGGNERNAEGASRSPPGGAAAGTPEGQHEVYADAAPAPAPPKKRGRVPGKKRAAAAAGGAAASGAAAGPAQPAAGWVSPPATCRVRSGERLAYAHTPAVHAVRVNDLLGILAEAGRAAEAYLEEAEPGSRGRGSSGSEASAGAPPPVQNPLSRQLEKQPPQQGAHRADAAPAVAVLPAAAVAAASAAQSLGRLAGQAHVRRLRAMAVAALPAWEVRRVLACRAVAADAQAAAVLRVAPDVGREEVRVAFRRLSLLVHPDKNRSPGAAEAFSLVSAAASHLLGKAR